MSGKVQTVNLCRGTGEKVEAVTFSKRESRQIRRNAKAMNMTVEAYLDQCFRMLEQGPEVRAGR